MKLTLEGLKDTAGWEKAGISIPKYDISKVRENTRLFSPWVHFGIGNIFRIFLGDIAERLIEQGDSDKGITCVETFDFDVVDKIYDPYDNLALLVTLYSNGNTEKKVIGSLSEAIAAKPGDTAAIERLTEIFINPGLQLISFTITEKGYALHGSDGDYFPFVKEDIEKGPSHISCAMSLVCAMLLKRFKAGKYPLALVSMDNVSENGKKLRDSVSELAGAWVDRGFAPSDFLEYVNDESRIAFPWTMIDKITPRPSDNIAASLKADGISDMDLVITSRKTYIAPYVNAEAPQYLVVEDSFPNGRPAFEKAGVYVTDRETVNKAERMKVTVALNPLHKPLGYFGCLFGHALVSDAMKDPDILSLVETLGLKEGMKVVEDPGIISPKAFIEEVLYDRFPNPFIPDTPERLVVDSSQMMLAMFGVTIKSYTEKFGTAGELTALPLTLASWMRYLLAVDDEGNPITLQADPMLEELTGYLKTVSYDKPESLNDQLKPILSNTHIFGIDLYEAGIGDKIEDMLKEMLNGKGSVRKTIHKYFG